MTSQTELLTLIFFFWVSNSISKKPFNKVLELVTWDLEENKISESLTPKIKKKLISELLTRKNKNYNITSSNEISKLKFSNY